MTSTKTNIGYELTFITKADISDDAQKAIVEKMKGIIEAHGGQMLQVEDWGRRKLTYPIKKESRGLYTHILYTGNNSCVAELERNIRINETIIRYLTIKVGDDFDQAKYVKGPTPITPPKPYGGADVH